jgi:hypothetical protein
VYDDVTLCEPIRLTHTRTGGRGSTGRYRAFAQPGSLLTLIRSLLTLIGGTRAALLDCRRLRGEMCVCVCVCVCVYIFTMCI